MRNDLVITPNNVAAPQAQTAIMETAKRAIMAKTGMSEKAWAQYCATVSIELFKLRTAYPTQARNYSEMETEALTALWLEIFSDVDLEVLHEAVIRFIAADRKAFFPSPGQVMGFIEQIMAELEAEERQKANERHMAELGEYFWHIEQGEHCGNCSYCEHEAEKLFCTNTDSCYYTGDGSRRIGTTKQKRCELFQEKWHKRKAGNNALVEEERE